MAVTSLLAILVLSGLIRMPFGGDFTVSVEEAETGEIVCPPEGSKPVDLDGVKIKVYNATGRPGLAGTVGERLSTYGLAPEEPGNYAGQFYGTTRISASKSRIVQAYTISRLFPESSVRYDEADTDIVTIILGEHFSEMLPEVEAEKVMSAQDQPFVTPKNCKVAPE